MIRRSCSLLVKARAVDIVLAIDASADTEFSWPNGTSLLATADRAANYSQGYWSFPPIPATSDDFVEQGLNVRPVFFGCNATNMANMTDNDAYPIVVYLPNAPVAGSSYSTNTSTFQLNYDIEDVVSFLDNAHTNALKGFSLNSTRDDQLAQCLKCAVVDRARTRAMIQRSEICEQCFTRYCWSDGVADQLAEATNATTPANTPASGAPSVGVGRVGASVVVATLLALAFA